MTIQRPVLEPIPYITTSLMATEPTKNHHEDAAFDLYASEDLEIAPGERVLVNTGIAMAITKGYSGFIWDRSGMAAKYGIHCLAGVIDSTYRGEIKVCLLNTNKWGFWRGLFGLNPKPHVIEIGQRIAQITIQPTPFFKMKRYAKLDNTARGESGFGSSGK